MGGMTPVATAIEGLYEIHTPRNGDERGCFSRIFCEREFACIRPNLHFTQINLSETKSRGTVRGMHYQPPPNAEAKLIRCIRGRAFDVAIDLRKGSRTFLNWHGMELTEGGHAIFIPEGFAHGFQALTDDVEMLYMHTAAWSAGHEAGLRYDDPDLAISWPTSIKLVSERDACHPLINDRFAGVSL